MRTTPLVGYTCYYLEYSLKQHWFRKMGLIYFSLVSMSFATIDTWLAENGGGGSSFYVTGQINKLPWPFDRPAP